MYTYAAGHARGHAHLLRCRAKVRCAGGLHSGTATARSVGKSAARRRSGKATSADTEAREAFSRDLDAVLSGAVATR